MVSEIQMALECKKYCSAVFLDVAQAFDKVWHDGLLFKLKRDLPHHFYLIIKSYLKDRHFYVKYGTDLSKLYPIHSGVPQGSVLGPLLYLLFTADLPTTNDTTTVTFADDTAILSSHSDPELASQHLQSGLNAIEEWLNTWRININELKSIHVTFTLKRETCPPIRVFNKPIPQASDAKYLGMHLDRRLTWNKHINTK